MAQSPTELVKALLDDPTNPEVVKSLVAPDATYVSLNYANDDLKRIMPWAGTAKGPDAVLSTYMRVGAYWKNEGFAIRDLFGEGENVAVFGILKFRSKTLGKAITSPFSIFAKVKEGKITYMQFMEDTFGTASTFRTGGAWTVHSDPNGPEIRV